MLHGILICTIQKLLRVHDLDCSPSVEAVPHQALLHKLQWLLVQAADHISWQFWRLCKRFVACPLQFTWRVNLSSRCWSSCSWKQTFPGMLYGFQQRPSGTCCISYQWLAFFKQLSTVCSFRLSLNTDPTCCRNLIIVVVINKNQIQTLT